MVADQASPIFAAMIFLLVVVGLRGIYFPDLNHCEDNDNGHVPQLAGFQDLWLAERSRQNRQTRLMDIILVHLHRLEESSHSNVCIISVSYTHLTLPTIYSV